ncbi:hypothetical protein C0J52_08121 [Blattella germanica]|nr:hypothetical protein C0J52_08121 [Blattella germanica]
MDERMLEARLPNIEASIQYRIEIIPTQVWPLEIEISLLPTDTFIAVAFHKSFEWKNCEFICHCGSRGVTYQEN